MTKKKKKGQLKISNELGQTGLQRLLRHDPVNLLGGVECVPKDVLVCIRASKMIPLVAQEPHFEPARSATPRIHVLDPYVNILFLFLKKWFRLDFFFKYEIGE